MPTSTAPGTEQLLHIAVHAAVLRALDEEIGTTEAHLEDLRRKRQAHQELKPYFDLVVASASGQPFIVDAKNSRPLAPKGGRGSRGWGENSHHAIVRKLITDQGLVDFHTRDVTKLAEQQGLSLNGRQVSNALSRLRADNEIEPVPERGKGEWHVIGSENAEGPAEAGPSNETSPSLAPEVEAG